jgi:hypothetical protein
LKPKALVERRKRLVDMVQALEEAVQALYLPKVRRRAVELRTEE